MTPFALAMQLTWTATLGATGYEVQRATDQTGTGLKVIMPATDSLALLDTLMDVNETTATQRYWRVRGINLSGNGPWSLWRGGTVLPADGANIKVNSITAAQLAADAAVFNKITANQFITLLGVLRTATDANQDTRVEVRGSVGTYPNMIRLIENMTSYAAIRGILDGSGAMFYSNNTMNEAAALRSLGFRIYSGGGLDDVVLRDGPGHILIGGTVKQLLNDNCDIVLGYGTRPLRITQAQTPAGNMNFLSFNSRTLWGAVARGAVPGEYGALMDDGRIGFGNGNNNPDVYIDRMTGGSYGTGLDLAGARLKANEFYSVRNTAVQGIYFLGDQSGGARYLLYNGSGYVMPGANLTLNGVNVSSSRLLKDEIREEPLDLAGFLRVTPKGFLLRNDPDGPRRLGFIAEELREALPQAVNDTPADDTAGTSASLAIDPLAIIAAQQAVLIDHDARIATLEATVAAQGEALAALTARLAALEGAAR